MCAHEGIDVWTHFSVLGVVVGHDTETLSQIGWKPMSTDQCLWCRNSDDGELKAVLGIHVDDFQIGLADGVLRRMWLSETQLLYRWRSC